MSEVRERSGVVSYTKGPWYWHKGYHEDIGHYSSLSNDSQEYEGDTIVASCDGCSIIRNEANARLISAAPEMLSALKDLFQMMDEHILVRNIDHDHEPGWAGLMMGVVTRLKFAHDAIAKAEGRDA